MPQAFDRKTQKAGDEALACALYAQLMNRSDGGAFDVLRSYGNLAAIQRNLLGWRNTEGSLWLEAQTGAFFAVNENLSNLIPALPIVLGAGGIATDFEGQPLLHRKLAQGRCNVLYAANPQIHTQCMAVIERAKKMIDNNK